MTILEALEALCDYALYKSTFLLTYLLTYIAPVCNNCNLQLKNRKVGNKSFIPLFMHNARSYDSHFIIKNLHDLNAKVQVIPTNSEKFLAVQIDSIRFLDSFQFLSSSLDKLVSTMALLENTSPVAFAVYEYQNFPSMITKFTQQTIT